MRALPIAIHRQRGTYRADRHGGRPEPKPAIPKAPKAMGVEAKKMWRYFATRLAAERVLTGLDQQALFVYCCAAARLAKAEKAIAEMGEVVKTVTGAGPNPWLAIAAKCQEMMLRFGQELGLSPLSRTKIKVEPEQAPALASRFRAPWKK
jgi:P27 family predicted phage terminase small subunit